MLVSLLAFLAESLFVCFVVVFGFIMLQGGITEEKKKNTAR
jgi:hypothetical protein